MRDAERAAKMASMLRAGCRALVDEVLPKTGSWPRTNRVVVKVLALLNDEIERLRAEATNHDPGRTPPAGGS